MTFQEHQNFYTALHLFCERGDLKAIERCEGMLDAKILNSQDFLLHNTPLHFAIYAGQKGIVKYLLETYHDKIDFTKKNRNGWSLFHIASFKSDLDTCELLYHYDKNIDTLDAHGKSPVFYACLFETFNFELIKWFSLRGANLRRVSLDGETCVDKMYKEMFQRCYTIERHLECLEREKKVCSLKQFQCLKGLLLVCL